MRIQIKRLTLSLTLLLFLAAQSVLLYYLCHLLERVAQQGIDGETKGFFVTIAILFLFVLILLSIFSIIPEVSGHFTRYWRAKEVLESGTSINDLAIKEKLILYPEACSSCGSLSFWEASEAVDCDKISKQTGCLECCPIDESAYVQSVWQGSVHHYTIKSPYDDLIKEHQKKGVGQRARIPHPSM